MHDDDEMNQDETGEGALEALRRVLSDLRQPGPRRWRPSRPRRGPCDVAAVQAWRRRVGRRGRGHYRGAAGGAGTPGNYAPRLGTGTRKPGRLFSGQHRRWDGGGWS